MLACARCSLAPRHMRPRCRQVTERVAHGHRAHGCRARCRIRHLQARGNGGERHRLPVPPSGQEIGLATEARLWWPLKSHHGRSSATPPSTSSRRPSSIPSPASSTSSSSTLPLRQVRAASRAQRSRVLAAPCLPLSSNHPSHPLKHTPLPPPPLLAIPHVGRRRRGREPPAAASPRSRFFGIDSSLRWRRATVGAGRGAAEAAGGGLAGGGRPPRLRRRVPAAGTGWVAPREPETPPPSHVHVHARAHARTVTFKYNCVTVRRPRVYIKLSMAISIVLDSGVSLGCSPPPRKGARGRVHRPPSVPSSTGTPKSRT